MAGFGNAPSGSYFIDSSSRIFISSSAATGTTKEIVIEPFSHLHFMDQIVM